MNWSISPLVIWALIGMVAGPLVVWGGASMVMWIERRYSDPFAGH